MTKAGVSRTSKTTSTASSTMKKYAVSGSTDTLRQGDGVIVLGEGDLEVAAGTPVMQQTPSPPTARRVRGRVQH